MTSELPVLSGQIPRKGVGPWDVGAVVFFFWWEKTLPPWYPSTGVVPDLGFDCHFWKCSEQAAVSWKKWNDGTFNMAQCYEITQNVVLRCTGY